jgi:hypothetical protein
MFSVSRLQGCVLNSQRGLEVGRWPRFSRGATQLLLKKSVSGFVQPRATNHIPSGTHSVTLLTLGLPHLVASCAATERDRA